MSGDKEIVPKKKLRVGMIGYQFMGRAHSNAYRNLSFYFNTEFEPVMQVICGQNEEKVKVAAERYGWKEWETDWRRLVARDDIDVIDISTPNYLHAEIALAAVKAGKHIICEKPLAMNVQEAEEMVEAVRESGVKAMICHNYRFVPAVVYAKRLIEEGLIGNVIHIRSEYLQDWGMEENGEFSKGWRAHKKYAGSGVLGDTASHIIDLARFLVGDEMQEVVGMMRSLATNQADEQDRVDDMAILMAKFQSGISATFEANRFAAGHKNGNRFEINGENGSIRWDLENLNEIEIYLKEDQLGIQGFRKVHCTSKMHPYGSAYWAEGLGIGYEQSFLQLFEAFFNEKATKMPPYPTFEEGLKNQRVLEAVEKSVHDHCWIKVEN